LARKRDAYATLEGRVSKLIERIESSPTFPCRSGPLCRWCEYADICEK
jgi:CRISPR/Cas system-associated exonuclease Cas4 (RecB family)